MMAASSLPRVLVLVHRFADKSAYSFYVQDQVQALHGLGLSVTVVAPVAAMPGQRFLRPEAYKILKETPAQATVDGIPVYYPRFPALGNAGEALLGGRHEADFAWPTVKKLHAQAPFDLIHGHLLTMDGHAALRLGERLGIPVALTAHGTDVFRYYRENPSTRNRRIVAEAGALMAVSRKLADILAPYRPQGGIRVIPNGVDTSRVPWGDGAGSGRLLSVGTLKPRKGMMTTLEAFARIAGEFPGASLTIVGEGPDRPALEARIAELSLGGRVTLTGGLPRDELLTLMATCDAFLLPSYDEGFGVVYIEAMAAGCVAVGARDEGIADVIKDGDNGLLVPVEDPAALADATRKILRGGWDIDALRAKGTRDARRFTWIHNAGQVLSVYQQLLAASKA